MNPRDASTTATGAASPAVRFHLTLADRTETDAVGRYQRQRQLATDVVEAARRADSLMRLEMALRTSAGPLFQP